MSQPQIFKATYSGVPVYEMLCKGIAVMRRRSDSYLNATQILKVADFDKPQRTRILEREVQTGLHEKVQGGYGKYQGTWVPFIRGVTLAQQYQVDHLLQPILQFVKGNESPPLAPKHVTAATVRPRKPRETRRKRAKRLEEDVSEGDISSQYSDLHDHDPPISLETGSPSPSPLFRSTMVRDNTFNEESTSHANNSTSNHLLPPTQSSRIKRPRAAVEEALEDSEEEEGVERTYAQRLLRYFVSETQGPPSFLLHPPRDLDVNVIIDEEGHTSLHWAAAIGRIQIVKLLIDQGADIYRVNYKGQTALMRSVLFTNNFDTKSFQLLLDLLQKTIFNIDKKDQTVFHHVASTASWKGKVHASRYYMDCLIDKLAYNRSELISILNVQDVYGDTALTIASRIGNKKLIRLLVDAGASTEIANEEGMTSQDYLMEIERESTRNSHSHQDGDQSSPHSSGTEMAARTRLRQKVESMFKFILANDRSVPAVSQLFDGFASSYERELVQKEQDLKEKKTELDLVHKRLVGTQHVLDHTEADPVLLAQTEIQATQLAHQLRKLTQYVQKKKLNRLVQTTESMQAPLTTTDVPTLKHKKAQLLSQFVKLQKARQAKVDELMSLKSERPEKRYQEYKRLISMCCNVAYENVDVMLLPLLASFDEAAA
ncbi:apses-type HTH transcription regulator [Phycomyces blakesleeanus]|uniref:Apses-type HTH transcription regulator n=1 Tax=Phycomyces blakesleeanus TaxID=4837 RepID=A0ABR3B8D8_PHYBL